MSAAPCTIQAFSTEVKGAHPVPLPQRQALLAYTTTGGASGGLLEGALVKPLVLHSFESNCQGMLKKGYGRERIDAADFILLASRTDGVAMRSGSRAVTVCGFALLSKLPRETAGMCLDILCSCAHYGGRLLEGAESLARDRGCTHMQLNALPSAMDFYAARGYAEVRTAKGRRVGNASNGYRMTKYIRALPQQLQLQPQRQLYSTMRDQQQLQLQQQRQLYTIRDQQQLQQQQLVQQKKTQKQQHKPRAQDPTTRPPPRVQTAAGRIRGGGTAS